ncbi:MAG: O-antigen ligase family protein [Armatimonadetes bacterium]|nr:O-antigen ligase family protein [Armatimonadota bacterium]
MRRRIVALAGHPEAWLGLLLVWAMLSALQSGHTPWERAAGTEALRWGAGIALALALGHGLRRTLPAAQALTVLLAALVLTTLAAGLGPDGHITGPFRDHQLCASALLALLPFAAALALAAEQPRWRWGAQVVTLAAAVCLALTQTRSAWIGAGAAALVFAAHWLRRPQTSPAPRRRAWITPALLAVCVAGAFAVLAAGTDLGRPLAGRAGTLEAVGRDGSWQTRERIWRGAASMIPSHALAGWGLGRYPSLQWDWTHEGRPLSPTQRPSLSEQAHDFYLQTAIEMGGIGLILYLAALGALAAGCRRGLREPGAHSDGLTRALRVATLALIAGQGVDALASPSWQFAEVSLLFWAGLGVGLAAVRQTGADSAVSVSPATRRLLRLGIAATAAVALAAQCLPVGWLSPVEAYTPPAGYQYKDSTVYIASINGVAVNNLSSATVNPGDTVTCKLIAHYTSGGQDVYVDVTSDPNAGFVSYRCPGTTACTNSGSPSVSTFSGNSLTVSPSDAGHALTLSGHFYSSGAYKTAAYNASLIVNSAH